MQQYVCVLRKEYTAIGTPFGVFYAEKKYQVDAEHMNMIEKYFDIVDEVALEPTVLVEENNTTNTNTKQDKKSTRKTKVEVGE